jgi:hypothetical protein
MQESLTNKHETKKGPTEKFSKALIEFADKMDQLSAKEAGSHGEMYSYAAAILIVTAIGLAFGPDNNPKVDSQIEVLKLLSNSANSVNDGASGLLEFHINNPNGTWSQWVAEAAEGSLKFKPEQGKFMIDLKQFLRNVVAGMQTTQGEYLYKLNPEKAASIANLLNQIDNLQKLGQMMLAGSGAIALSVMNQARSKMQEPLKVSTSVGPKIAQGARTLSDFIDKKN